MGRVGTGIVSGLIILLVSVLGFNYLRPVASISLTPIPATQTSKPADVVPGPKNVGSSDGPMTTLAREVRESGDNSKVVEKLGDDKTTSEIANTIKDPKAPMGERVAALELTAHSSRPEITATLNDASKDDSPAIRSAAVSMLAKKNSPDSLSIITQTASDKDVSVRRAAVYGLSERNEKEALKALVTLLNDEDSLVRKVASGALTKKAANDFGYKYSASKTERAEAVKKWQNWVEAK
jgi:hypothetical protein